MTLDDLTARLRERLRGRVDSAALEAELLVARAAGLERAQLLARGRDEAAREVVAAACRFAVRRLAGEPVALLLGGKEFWGRRFALRPGVLVPRPDTETLVEAALAVLRRGRVADVGCGSGAIAVTLAAERPELAVVAIDRSPVALECARGNAVAHGVGGRVACVRGDLLGAVAPRPCLDAVVSNPPYVEPLDWPGLPREVQLYEPRLALAPLGESAASLRARLIGQARERLVPGGWLAIEVGAGQAGVARDQLRAAGFTAVTIVNDFASIGRVVHGRRG